MELLEEVSIVLSIIVAIWFFYDKWYVIKAWVKPNKNNYYERDIFDVSDENFLFMETNLDFLTTTGYLPVNELEKETCISLSNQGILDRSFWGKYKLTIVGKRMMSE